MNELENRLCVLISNYLGYTYKSSRISPNKNISIFISIYINNNKNYRTFQNHKDILKFIENNHRDKSIQITREYTYKYMCVFNYIFCSA